MAILVNNQQDQITISEGLLSLLGQIGDDVLRMEGQPQESEVSITLVDNAYIQELNRTYRGLDRPTDVLAFYLEDDMPAMEEEKMLGDVLVSVEKADEQAREYGHSLEREVAFLTVHGILHLLGYDHHLPQEEEKMKSRQKLFLERFKL